MGGQLKNEKSEVLNKIETFGWLILVQKRIAKRNTEGNFKFHKIEFIIEFRLQNIQALPWQNNSLFFDWIENGS